MRRISLSSIRRTIEERIPLKQGLKHIPTQHSESGKPIEERIPLKQGLKLTEILSGRTKERRIEERIPLKQGLKPDNASVTLSVYAKLKKGFH